MAKQARQQQRQCVAEDQIGTEKTVRLTAQRTGKPYTSLGVSGPFLRPRGAGVEQSSCECDKVGMIRTKEYVCTSR